MIAVVIIAVVTTVGGHLGNRVRRCRQRAPRSVALLIVRAKQEAPSP